MTKSITLAGLEFEVVMPGVYLHETRNSDVLITRMGEKDYEVHIHARDEKATVLTGPYRFPTPSGCAVWAQARV